MTNPPPPPPSSSGGTPPPAAPPPGGAPQPPSGSVPSGGNVADGRRPWWSAGRVIAAIVIVLVLMGGAGTVGFFAGAAWSGAETIGQGIVDDFSEDFSEDFSDGTDGPTVGGDEIQVGDTVTGSFDDEAVEHTLTVEEATPVTVELRSDDFDTTLTVLGETGEELAYNDDIEFGEDRNSRLEVTLEPGTYSVVVDAFGSGEGSYELAVR